MANVDPIAAVRAYVDATFKGLDLSGVTARVAKDRCDAALEALQSQCDLVTRFERPRQERVAKDRAQAAAAKAAEQAREAQAKQARIERRKALRS